MYEEYLWIFVVSVFLAVFVAWGIGANDVVSTVLHCAGFRAAVDCQYAKGRDHVQANSFGSSVGTKAFTMGQVGTPFRVTSQSIHDAACVSSLSSAICSLA